MKDKILLVKEGMRMLQHAFSKESNKCSGTPKEIGIQIINSCWNGKYFQVSSGHFNCFYIRDFGWCIDSLLELGYKKKVNQTLAYVLKQYEKKRLTTTITPDEHCIDVFNYAIDSLPYLIRSLSKTKAFNLIKQYKDFLEKETKIFYKKVFNPNTGLVYENKHFSSMKDHSLRKSSTYDNVMVAMLSKELDKLKLYNPLPKFKEIKTTIKKNLWQGEYFYNDMKKENIITGDSNVFPFWLEIFTEKDMLKKSIQSIQKEKLDSPFPLKYNSRKHEKLNFANFLAANYETNSIWMHMGPLYVKLLLKINKKQAAKHIKKYTELLLKQGTSLEIYNKEGKPFKKLLYHSDTHMLWVANHLTLLNKIKN